MLLILVGSALVAVGAIYWLAYHRPAVRGRAPREPKLTGRFGAVEIRIRGGACEAARALEGQRMLSRQAPALPLAACDSAQCSCSFVKLSDRRTETRRLEHGGLSAALFLMTNRRAKRERRRAERSSR
jgi:hypothetical protein